MLLTERNCLAENTQKQANSLNTKPATYLGMLKKSIPWVPLVGAVFFFVLGFLILLHQQVNWRVWFELRDLHHETLAIDAFLFGLGILVGAVIVRENRK